MEFSKRTQTHKSNIFLVLNQLRTQVEADGFEVIDLSVGTPDLPPDDFVLAELSGRALDPENYKYSLKDLPQLKQAVANWYSRRYGVSLEENEIMSVNGSQEGIAHLAFPICNPGDIVLVPNPGYPIFSHGPALAGAKLVEYSLLEENDYQIDFDGIDEEIARAAKMIIISYPNNPVCAIAKPDFFAKLVDFCRRYDILAVHDNAYSELVHGVQGTGSFLAQPGAKEVGIEFNSLSKSYNLSGMRVSFCLGNAEVIKHFSALRSQIDYGMFYPCQYAAIAALNGSQDILARNRDEYSQRRLILHNGLKEIGWESKMSLGTMFSWLKIPQGFKNSQEFVIELIKKAHVCCVPGDAFGTLGEGYVRMALVQSPEKIKQAVANIGNMLKG